MSGICQEISQLSAMSPDLGTLNRQTGWSFLSTSAADCSILTAILVIFPGPAAGGGLGVGVFPQVGWDRAVFPVSDISTTGLSACSAAPPECNQHFLNPSRSHTPGQPRPSQHPGIQGPGMRISVGGGLGHENISYTHINDLSHDVTLQ